MTVSVQTDIFRFEITVDDFVIVQEFQPEGNFSDVKPNVVLFQALGVSHEGEQISS